LNRFRSKWRQSAGHHVNPSTFSVEFDFAVDESEQSVVLAASDAAAGVELGSTLANEDITRSNHFAAKFLDATALCIGVAAVSARTLTLLVCHLNLSDMGILAKMPLVFYGVYRSGEDCSSANSAVKACLPACPEIARIDLAHPPRDNF